MATIVALFQAALATGRDHSDTIPQLLAGAFVALLCFRFVYRSFFHPLANIPGPHLARFSRLWVLRLTLSGSGSRQLLDLHKKHGTDLLRIAPNEVSLCSREGYNFLYSQRNKYEKDGTWYQGMLPKKIMNLFAMTDREMHSSIKRLFSYGFSRTNILEFEPTIHANVKMAMARTQHYVENNRAVPLHKLATSFTLDTISKITFGERMGALDRPNLDLQLLNDLDALFREAIPMCRAVYSFLHGMKAVTNMSRFGEYLAVIARCVQQAQAGNGDESLVKESLRRGKEANIDLDNTQRVSIMSQIVTAGYGTTAVSISCTLQWMMRNPNTYERARDELRAAKLVEGRGALTVADLEQLPYFEACIKEGLRITCAAPVKMPRVVGPEGYQYNEHFLPPGTIVSSSNYFFCFNEQMFPDPETFNPDHWLSPDLKEYNMQWMIFSRGSRSCIGIHMAMAEIRVFLAEFIARFSLVEFVDEYKMSERMVADSDNLMRVHLKNV